MIYRSAVRGDLPSILALLVDDELGRTRDSAVVDDVYEQAFADILADPRTFFLVGEEDGEVVGCAQLTYIPGLGRHGMERCLIEAVRIRSDMRGQGLGHKLISWAIDTARERGCGIVQLTSDGSRAGAHRFYESLGFVPTHVGFKLHL